MTDQNFYSGYYCKKCKYIPLMQIIPRNENLFILSLCHCGRVYQKSEFFHEKFYKTNIVLKDIYKLPLININEEIKEEDISLKYEEFKNIRDKIKKHSEELFDNLINYIKEKDPDNLNNNYKQYIQMNNKIISIIENFFNTHQLIKDNPSIKLNISKIQFNKDFSKKDYKYLLKSSPDIYYKNSIKFYKEEFIISQSSESEQLNMKYFASQNNSALCFLEITDKVYAAISRKCPCIYLYNIDDIKSKKIIIFNADSVEVKWIIKTWDNYLISCGISGYIKLWPIFDETTFEKVENKSIIDINSIYSFFIDKNELRDIQKLININENLFIGFSNKYIFLFNYIIEDNKRKINLIKTSKNIDIIDIIFIKRERKESFIGAYNKNELFLIKYDDLEIIKNIKLNNTEEKNCLIQLNENEIMIVQNNKNLLGLDIDNLSIKFIYNNNVDTDYLFKLKDGTIIQSGSSGMRRIMPKTFQELPILYTPFKDTEYDHPYNVYEKITCLKELSNGYLIKCVVIGQIYFCKISFI